MLWLLHSPNRTVATLLSFTSLFDGDDLHRELSAAVAVSSSLCSPVSLSQPRWGTSLDIGRRLVVEVAAADAVAHLSPVSGQAGNCRQLFQYELREPFFLSLLRRIDRRTAASLVWRLPPLPRRRHRRRHLHLQRQQQRANQLNSSSSSPCPTASASAAPALKSISINYDIVQRRRQKAGVVTHSILCPMPVALTDTLSDISGSGIPLRQQHQQQHRHDLLICLVPPHHAQDSSGRRRRGRTASKRKSGSCSYRQSVIDHLFPSYSLSPVVISPLAATCPTSGRYHFDPRRHSLEEREGEINMT